MILSQQLLTSSSKNPSHTATRYLGKEQTYKDLLASTSKLSYLYQREVGHGARVAFYARNCPAYISTFIAMSNIRSLCIPIYPEAAPEEVIKWLKDSKATHVMVSNDLAQKAREILRSQRMNLPVIEMERKHGGEYDSTFTPSPDQVPLDSDPVLLLRSAGTTGKPKYVPFNPKQILHAVTSLQGPYHLTGGDCVHTALEWNHPFAWIHGMLLPLMAGATLVIDHGLLGVEYLDFLLSSKVTRLVSTPPAVLKLLILCKNEKRVLPGIKSVTVGLGYLSVDLRKALELLQIRVSHCYGQVENVWTLALEDTQQSEPLEPGANYSRGFVGKGLPGLKYKVVDKNGDLIEGSEERVGQLAVSGPTVMQAYLNREKESKGAVRGTWLYTGDLVKLNGREDSPTLTFLARKEDSTEVDGSLVLLNQIESTLKSHQMVQDGAVFLIKDSRERPVIVCAVVKKSGISLSEKQVLEHCSASMPGNRVPKGVAFTDMIPRDLGNNVNYSKLRSQFSGMLS